MSKSIYEIKADQLYDILIPAINSIYSDEINDPDADEMLFEMKQKFINELYNFEENLSEFKEALAQSQRDIDARNEALNSFTQNSFERNSDRF